MDLIDATLRCEKPNPRFAYLSPFYAQSKDVAWTYLKEYGLRFPGTVPNENELRLDFPGGARVRLYGADNYDRMRGIYLDGVVLDEYADMDPRVWPEVIRPALSDRKGWATFIGTPKGRNGFFDTWQHAKDDPAWFSMMLKASESGLVVAEELADARRMMTPEQYEQEFECSFDAAILGAYYASLVSEAEAEGRICPLEADPALLVHTAWDLGIGDSTVIWLWQAAPDGIRILDHIEDHGKSLPFYAAELTARGHRYGIDYVPHDARARELGTGKTRVETLVGLGRNPQLVPIHSVDDGINAVRQMLPVMWFNSEKCAAGVEALRQYRTDYDEKLKAFKNRPRHDWTSHSADALRYLSMGYREFLVTKPKPKPERKAQFGQVYLPGPPRPVSKTRIKI